MVILLYTSVLSVLSIPPAMLLGSWSDQRQRSDGGTLPPPRIIMGNLSLF